MTTGGKAQNSEVRTVEGALALCAELGEATEKFRRDVLREEVRNRERGDRFRAHLGTGARHRGAAAVDVCAGVGHDDRAFDADKGIAAIIASARLCRYGQ